MLLIVLVSAIILITAYFSYGRLLARLFQLDDTAGARSSFMAVGLIWLAAIVATFFLRKPEETVGHPAEVPAAHA